MNDGTVRQYNYTIDKQQLAVFALNPKTINHRVSYWLRNLVSSTRFVCINSGGIGYYATTFSGGVRPAFAIG
jgi:hypothetical protein